VPRTPSSQLTAVACGPATWIPRTASAARAALAQPNQGYMGGCMSEEVGDAVLLYGFLFLLLVWSVASLRYGSRRHPRLDPRRGQGPNVLRWFAYLAGLVGKRRDRDGSD